MSELVAIKGNKDGLRIQIDELADWPQVIDSLRDRLVQGGSFFAGARLLVELGERPVNKDQLDELLALLQQHGVQPDSLAAAARESRNAARAAGITARPPSRQTPPATPGVEGEATLVWRTVRSGQVIRHVGHITVIGDVNGGAEIIAGGNVVVWGRVRGFVHAGALGNRSAVICALELRPTQLRIADLIAQPGEGIVGRAPEVARIEGDRISVESWEAYRKS